MDNFRKLKRQVQLNIFGLGSLTVVVLVGISWLARKTFPGHNGLISIILLFLGVFAVWLVSLALTDYALTPLDIVWRAILHVTPGHSNVTPPNLEKNKIGQELVTTLALQVYQLASNNATATKTKTSQEVQAKSLNTQLSDDLPLPLFAVAKDQTISFANEAALKYLGLSSQDVLQKNLYSVLDLSFSDEDTLDSWLKDCRANKATDQHSWQRARLKMTDQLSQQSTIKQFDLAASYSKGDPNGIEVVLCLFDQTKRYGSDDQALDFIALAVHELRTPLTAMRGYIEVFEDELDGKLDKELTSFMHKMQASAQQLTAFVGNILNVARIEDGDLALQLTEEDWASIVKGSADTMSLPASLRSIQIKYTIDANVPPVGVDKTSITEVLNNLLENAIKYSGQGKIITIHSALNKVGLVETTVQDNGVGIPAGVMPTLFQKFHRNYHNEAKVGGTGLGLYLCSALVKAHGGNIWVKSKEGQGTTVGFTVQPYGSLAASVKDSNNKDITRNAHGWIKNHSLFRK